MGRDEEEREEEDQERLRGGAVFLAMQVLRIPAGGRGFPLVIIIAQFISSALPAHKP